MTVRNKTNAYFIASGFFLLIISGVIGWLCNAVIYNVFYDFEYFLIFFIPAAVVWYIPITYLHQFGISVIRGESRYFSSLNPQLLKFTTFTIFVLTALVSQLFLAGKYMNGFSSGIEQASTAGYVIIMCISYASVFIIRKFNMQH